MTNAKSIEDKYKKLTDIQHCRARPGRYIGAIAPTTAQTFVPVEGKFERVELTYNPGFQKLFDEIVSNSVDFSKRPEGKHLNTIKVTIDQEQGVISVEDNGGIPVAIHTEYQEHVPTMIFGSLRAGSNFDDDDEADNTGTGSHGEGASLVNVFSTKFIVETCDGKNSFKQVWTDGMQNTTEPTILPAKNAKGFTRITYYPDFQAMKMERLDDGNYDKLVKRVYDIAGCNPRLNIYLNGEAIKIASFKDYIAMYDPVYVYEEQPDWQIGVTHSDDGYQQISFVNSTETIQGGTHTAHIAYELAEKLRAHFKKKHKVDVRPTDILNHMRIYANVVMNRPRYDSQTKERLITDKKEWRSAYVASEKMITQLLKSEIIQRVLDWVEAKKKAQDMAELRSAAKELKTTNVKRIDKLQDANFAGKRPGECILMLTEGDSASKPIQLTCDRDRIGVMALRGKLMNVRSRDLAAIFKKKEKKNGDEERNKEGQEILNVMMALGLKLGEPVKDVSQLRYSKVATTTDADNDGAHITGLVLSFLHKFWPELFEMGVIHRFQTPIVKAWVNGSKKPLNFFYEHEFEAWKVANKNAKFKSKYYKGLGTSTDKDFKEYFDNIDEHLIRVDIKEQQDHDDIELVFGKTAGAADRRKVWLNISDESVAMDANELMD